jgi:hypothetical protein
MKPAPGTVHHVTTADRGQTLAAFLREDLDRWGPVIRASGATID